MNDTAKILRALLDEAKRFREAAQIERDPALRCVQLVVCESLAKIVHQVVKETPQ